MLGGAARDNVEGYGRATGPVARLRDGTLATTFGTLATILAGAPRTLPPGECVTLDENFESVMVHKTLDEDNVSWRGTLNYEPADDRLFYVCVSKGYKAGNFSTIPGLTPEQFDPLRQESILAYEAGIKLTLVERTLQLNSAVFYYDDRDKQLLGSIQNPIFGTLPGSVAIPKSEVRGWEADLTWQPTDGLHLTAAVNWVDSEIESDPPLPIDPYGTLTTFIGERFPYTPEWQATTGGEYEFTVGTMRWSLGAGLNYRSDSYSNFGENAMFLLGERVLVDVRVGLVGPAGNWRVQLYGRNVTDERYFTQTSRLTDTVVSYTGMPRTYGIQFWYRH